MELTLQFDKDLKYTFIHDSVAILILLELTLQLLICMGKMRNLNCRNPYFIGINSAILLMVGFIIQLNSRNPYFIGINSAIRVCNYRHRLGNTVAILILLELTLQYKTKFYYCTILNSRNPYFIGINSAIHIKSKSYLWLLMSQSLFYWN